MQIPVECGSHLVGPLANNPVCAKHFHVFIQFPNVGSPKFYNMQRQNVQNSTAKGFRRNRTIWFRFPLAYYLVLRLLVTVLAK